MKRWSTHWAIPCSQLTIDEIFRDSPIFHAMNVAEPSDSELPEQEVHAEGACFLQYDGVGDLALPSYAHDASKATKAVLLSGIG